MNFSEEINNKNTGELLEIYGNAQEYQESFISLVSAELEKRGVNTSEHRKKAIERENLLDEKIKTGEQGDPLYITIGFISSILGGIIGLSAGFVYSFSKRTDSKGIKHYRYNAETRKKGNLMAIIGTTVFLAFLAIKIGI